MEEKRFKIRGVNPKTLRHKTVYVSGSTVEDASINALIAGVEEPLSVEELPQEPPSESQLSYARDLGLPIPVGATKTDLSAILTKHLEHDNDSGQDLIDYANGHNLLFSKYIGKRALYDLVFHRLPEEDRVAFFCFSVYRWLTDDRRGNLSIHPNKHIFFEFAAVYKNNQRFIKSMNGYEGSQIRFFGTLRFPDGQEMHGGSVNTIAYKEACIFLSKSLGISTSKKTHQFKDPNKKRAFPKKSEIAAMETQSIGCSLILIITLSMLFLGWLC